MAKNDSRRLVPIAPNLVLVNLNELEQWLRDASESYPKHEEVYLAFEMVWNELRDARKRGTLPWAKTVEENDKNAEGQA